MRWIVSVLVSAPLLLTPAGMTSAQSALPLTAVGSTAVVGLYGIYGEASLGGGAVGALFAVRLSDGSSSGWMRRVGPVIEVVPPSAARDFWCVAGMRVDVPQDREFWFIKNVGDGVTALDRYSFSSGGASYTCSTFPVGDFNPVEAGDFKVFPQRPA